MRGPTVPTVSKQPTIHGAGRGERFCFSVVRVVPDPIKDEAVNVGVVVARAEGAGDRVFSK